VFELAPHAPGASSASKRYGAARAQNRWCRSLDVFPGSLYSYLAFVAGRCMPSSGTQTAVVRLREQGGWAPCGGRPRRTLRQPDSAGITSAHLDRAARSSSIRFSLRRGAHFESPAGTLKLPVDQARRDLLRQGREEPTVRGLTRPNARLHRCRPLGRHSGRRACVCEGERSVPHTRLQGWTRGLCLRGNGRSSGRLA